MRRSVPLVLLLAALTLAATAPAAPEPAPRPKLYVFVSASMPRGSLLAVATDSVPHRAPLILRGLVGDSLQETLANLKDLAHAGASIQIDPLLYEAYGVERVPAVVRTCGERGEGPFAIVYGLTVSQALPFLTQALEC